MPNFKPYQYHFYQIGYKKETIEQQETIQINDTNDLEKFKVGFKKFLYHESADEEL